MKKLFHIIATPRDVESNMDVIFQPKYLSVIPRRGRNDF
jgi:hypothetical protein